MSIVIRIAGIEIPMNKRGDRALTKIRGIGLSTAVKILSTAGVSPDKHPTEWPSQILKKIRKEIEELTVETDLLAVVKANIGRLKSINCLRGRRHKMGLPVRGQRTRSNARTRKGPRGLAIAKKKKPGAKK